MARCDPSSLFDSEKSTPHNRPGRPVLHYPPPPLGQEGGIGSSPMFTLFLFPGRQHVVHLQLESTKGNSKF